MGKQMIELHRKDVAGKWEISQRTSLDLSIFTKYSYEDTTHLMIRIRRQWGGNMNGQLPRVLGVVLGKTDREREREGQRHIAEIRSQRN